MDRRTPQAGRYRIVKPVHASYQKHSATSRAGARHADKTIGLATRAVLNVIVRTGGATIAEIAHELHTDKSGVSGRVADMHNPEKFNPVLIQDSGETRAREGITRVPGTVWTATAEGLKAAGFSTVTGRADESAGILDLFSHTK